MSVVAVKRTGRRQFEIAADSINTWGNTQSKDRDGKLWLIERGLVVGQSGLSSVGTLLRVFIRQRKPTSNTEEGWLAFAQDFMKVCRNYDLNSAENSFIIVYHGKAWRL